MTEAKPAGPGPVTLKLRALRVTLVVEGVVALVLAITGLVLIWTQKNRPDWSGFGLIVLGLLVYMLRGQVITKLSVGKDGIAWEMAERALDKAEHAERAAQFAGDVIDQQLAAGGKGTPPASGEAAASIRAAGRAQLQAPEKGSGWSHPELDKERKGKPINEDDPQAGQWGGKAERNDRLLDAEFVRAQRGWVDVIMRVTSTDPANKPLVRPVRFHLHDSFNRSVQTVKPKNGVAELSRLAWGAFTVGAEVEGEPDTYLELNLATDPDAPEGWRDR